MNATVEIIEHRVLSVIPTTKKMCLDVQCFWEILGCWNTMRSP